MSWEIPKDDETSGFCFLKRFCFGLNGAWLNERHKQYHVHSGWRKMLVLWNIFWCQVQRVCWSPVTNFIPLICFWRFLTPPSLTQKQGQNVHAAHLCIFFLWITLGHPWAWYISYSSDYFSFPLAICLEIATSVLSKHCGKILAFLDMLQTTKIPIVHGMGSAFVWSTQVHQKKWWQIWLEDQ